MAKKDFSAQPNPVLRYISTAQEPEPAPTPKPKPEKKPATNTPERKTKRLNLLIQPSVFDDLAKVAAMRRTSVNDLLGTLARECVEENRGLVREYDKVFAGE